MVGKAVDRARGYHGVAIWALLLVIALWPGALVRTRQVAAKGFACPPVVSQAASPAASGTLSIAATPVPFPEEGGDLTVFAAASLTDPFERIATDLEATNPRLSVTYNFAGSQALVTQLGEGAEADVFAAADNAQMRAAAEQGSIVGEPMPFARNRLAVVVPSDNPASVTSPADLAKAGLRLVLAQAEVPAGRYAREAVCKMGADPDTYGEGFVAAVAGNVVSEEEDVRDVLTRVRLGEADAGIVYVTDVTAEVADEVALVEIPAAVNIVATYPIAAVAGGNTALADAFIAYVLGPDGQATLKAFGFAPPA